jgi:glycosyltransferase involved in cell wall biosynthesis
VKQLVAAADPKRRQDEAMGTPVSIAIPTLDAGDGLRETLRGVRAQRLDDDREPELLICDSGSRDETIAIAREHGARVIEIPRSEFSHGGTRNLLMAQARGEHVAFLTQDSVPAASDWLARLLAGFSLAPNVGLVFGPYLPRADASPSVARELYDWFESLSRDGAPRIDVLDDEQRSSLAARDFLGPRGFFTDANGCVSRSAWERVPFREVAYAEDHLLAQDMLRAGFAKLYLPEAAVVHSHEYSSWEWLRRSFDEARAIRAIYGEVPSGDARSAARTVWGNVGADLRWLRSGAPASQLNLAPALAGSLVHHAARAAGTLLGAAAGAERLPAALVARLSLEGRR